MRDIDNPIAQNLFHNKTGQLRGQRLEEGFINTTNTHLQHSELGTWTQGQDLNASPLFKSE